MSSPFLQSLGYENTQQQQQQQQHESKHHYEENDNEWYGDDDETTRNGSSNLSQAVEHLISIFSCTTDNSIFSCTDNVKELLERSSLRSYHGDKRYSYKHGDCGHTQDTEQSSSSRSRSLQHNHHHHRHSRRDKSKSTSPHRRSKSRSRGSRGSRGSGSRHRGGGRHHRREMVDEETPPPERINSEIVVSCDDDVSALSAGTLEKMSEMHCRMMNKMEMEFRTDPPSDGTNTSNSNTGTTAASSRTDHLLNRNDCIRVQQDGGIPKPQPVKQCSSVDQSTLMSKSFETSEFESVWKKKPCADTSDIDTPTSSKNSVGFGSPVNWDMASRGRKIRSHQSGGRFAVNTIDEIDVLMSDEEEI